VCERLGELTRAWEVSHSVVAVGMTRDYTTGSETERGGWRERGSEGARERGR
jgi:hypothetical protein